MQQVDEQKTEQVREICLTKELVIIDGQPGCGKTLFPSILATFERVEMMSYAFPLVLYPPLFLSSSFCLVLCLSTICSSRGIAVCYIHCF